VEVVTMTDPRWDEVGNRFTDLGRTLHERWSGTRGAARDAGADATDEVRSAMDGVRASLDGLTDAISHTVNDPEVHESAKAAAGGLFEALGASLDHLADRIQDRKPPD
jgi:uncharacterized protein YcbX